VALHKHGRSARSIGLVYDASPNVILRALKKNGKNESENERKNGLWQENRRYRSIFTLTAQYKVIDGLAKKLSSLEYK
jgi:hypothetical protein